MILCKTEKKACCFQSASHLGKNVADLRGYKHIYKLRLVDSRVSVVKLGSYSREIIKKKDQKKKNQKKQLMRRNLISECKDKNVGD